MHVKKEDLKITAFFYTLSQLIWNRGLPASVEHAARAGSDKSNVAHAGRTLQTHHALLDRQNKRWRGQEIDNLLYCLKAAHLEPVLVNI